MHIHIHYKVYYMKWEAIDSSMFRLMPTSATGSTIYYNMSVNVMVGQMSMMI